MDSGFSIAQLRLGLIFYIIFIASLCLREWARAWATDRLGDPNPAAQGRLTLNPLAHMDLFGSVIFPLVCILFFPGGLLFGWGKPVIPNPSYFSNPKRGEILIALTGPICNLALAFLATLAGALIHRFEPSFEELYSTLLLVNVLLAVFNLVPLPPLDGGILLKHLVGMSEEWFLRLSQWSLLVWLVLIYLPPVRFVFQMVLQIAMAPFVILYRALL